MQRYVFAVLTMLCLSGTAGAQPADSVDELIAKGIELRKRGDDRAALGLFQQAYAATPTPRAAGQLALAEQALGRWVAAERHITEALRSTSDPWVRKNYSSLTGALQMIQAHLGYVEVTGDPPGADVFVDGQPVGRLPLVDPVRVASGSVDVELRAPGFVTAGKTVAVPANGYERVFVVLYRQAPQPPAPVAQSPSMGVASTVAARAPTEANSGDAVSPSTLRASYKWIVWGAGAIGLGIGAYGAIENGRRTDAFTAAGCRLDNQGVAVLATTRAYDTHCNSLKGDYESATTIAVVGFVAGGVLAAAGAVLGLTEPKPTSAGVALQSCGLDGSRSALGAACAFRF
jgi:hypothetical protein